VTAWRRHLLLVADLPWLWCSVYRPAETRMTLASVRSAAAYSAPGPARRLGPQRAAELVQPAGWHPVALLVRLPAQRPHHHHHRCIDGAVQMTKHLNCRMTKQLLAAVVGVLISGTASAQLYAPAPPPPPGTVAVPVPPPVPVPGAGTTNTTTVSPSPDEDHRVVTIHREVDWKGNTAIEKDVHREGLAGSTDTHTKTETDHDGGSTTTTETNTNPR
jgi:hypothetical protein